MLMSKYEDFEDEYFDDEDYNEDDDFDNKRPSKGVVIVSIVCVLIGCVALVIQTMNVNDLSAIYDDNAKVIVELENEYDTLSGNDGTVVVSDSESAVKMVNSAEEAGNKVASYQNTYIATPSAISEEDTATLESTSAGMDDMLDDDSTDEVVPWYQPTDGVACEWVFNTTYDFTANTAPSLWTCCDSSGQLLAYGTATYNATTGLFSNVEHEMTSLGATHIGSTDNTAGVTT